MLRESLIRKISFCCATGAFLALLHSPTAVADNDIDMPAEIALSDDQIDVRFFELENAVRLEGEISNFISDDSFSLDAGTQDIRIDYGFLDMDEEDLRFLRNADRVTVYGSVDDDFFNERTLNARAIYIEDGARSILFE